MCESALRRKIKAEIDEVRTSQLAMYVGHMDEMQEYRPGYRAWGQEIPAGPSGYERALLLPLDRLERLWEEDDWGSAWESMDMEQREIWEHDDGLIAGLSRVLEWLES
jgi:hypothetical protein